VAWPLAALYGPHQWRAAGVIGLFNVCPLPDESLDVIEVRLQRRYHKLGDAEHSDLGTHRMTSNIQFRKHPRNVCRVCMISLPGCK